MYDQILDQKSYLYKQLKLSLNDIKSRNTDPNIINTNPDKPFAIITCDPPKYISKSQPISTHKSKSTPSKSKPKHTTVTEPKTIKISIDPQLFLKQLHPTDGIDTKQLQHQLTLSQQAIEYSNYSIKLESQFPINSHDLHKELIRLNSVRAAGASDWLRVHPDSILTQLSNSHFKFALRHRFGVKAFDSQLLPNNSRLELKCGYCNQSVSNDSYHSLSCVQLRKREIYNRHNAVARAIQIFAKRAGTMPQWEPKNHFINSDLTPDLGITIGNKLELVDVTIVRTDAFSRINSNSIPEFHTADIAAKGKIKKYKPNN